MDALTYLPASIFTPEQLVEAFNRSFEGYFVPMTHTVDSLHTLVTGNDVSLPHSFVAVDAHGHSAGIVLLAIRETRGWIGGMGLAPEWRGQGRSAPLMRAALEEARRLGLASVELEVLAQNTPAHRLYTSLGFEDIRSLAVFMGPLADGAIIITDDEAGNTSDEGQPITEISVERTLADFSALHQVTPPWQRDLPALQHMASSLRALALIDGDTVCADLLYMPSGLGYTIMDFGSRAASLDARRDDALALIRALLAETPGAPLRAINAPPGDALGDALTALGCPAPHTQWEMKLSLA